MNKGIKGLLKSASVGAGAGVATYGLIGGVGIATGGTAVGITFGPFVVIGASIGLLGYGIYRFGKQIGEKENKS